MKGFLKRRIADPLVGFIKQGVSPAKLAWAVSLGILLAVIPVFGASTLLCLAAIWCFRLNPPMLLLANQFAYPLQFLLYFPFIRAGEWLFGARHLPLSLTQIFQLFEKNVFQAISQLWYSTLYGLVAWLILSIPCAFLLFILLRFIFSKIRSRMSAVSIS